MWVKYTEMGFKRQKNRLGKISAVCVMAKHIHKPRTYTETYKFWMGTAYKSAHYKP